MSLTIIQPGLLASLQDCGRPNQQEFGIGKAGALDTLAYQLGQILVGNTAPTAAIEIFGGPFSLRCDSACWIAITGAEIEAEIVQPQHKQRLHSGWRYFLPAGSLLQLHGLRHGRCCYLSFNGVLSADRVLGSSSTDLAAGFGGWQGQPLRAQAELELQVGKACAKSLGIRQWQNDGRLRFLAGPEWSDLTPSSQGAFVSQAWQISAQSNRMAARLNLPNTKDAGFKTQNLALKQAKEMLSHAVFPGVVQLPPNGLPIVLQADAQCTGGYPRIATVIRADLWKLAQTLPGQPVHFEACDLVSAQRAWQTQQDWLTQIQRNLR